MGMAKRAMCLLFLMNGEKGDCWTLVCLGEKSI